MEVLEGSISISVTVPSRTNYRYSVRHYPIVACNRFRVFIRHRELEGKLTYKA